MKTNTLVWLVALNLSVGAFLYSRTIEHSATITHYHSDAPAIQSYYREVLRGSEKNISDRESVLKAADLLSRIDEERLYDKGLNREILRFADSLNIQPPAKHLSNQALLLHIIEEEFRSGPNQPKITLEIKAYQTSGSKKQILIRPIRVFDYDPYCTIFINGQDTFSSSHLLDTLGNVDSPRAQIMNPYTGKTLEIPFRHD